MSRIQTVFLSALSALFLCSAANSQETLQAEIDRSFEAVSKAVEDAGLISVLTIDHARLAAEEGVTMPPSRVHLFSDSQINAMIMQENVRAGLDLPFRALSYAEDGVPAVMYTPAAFIAQRHGLTSSPALVDFDTRLQAALPELNDVNLMPTPTDNIAMNFAIIELRSQFPVPETVARLKAAVTAQPDTIWFEEVDFQQAAAGTGVDLVPAQLLLFGGPAPGGVAMAEFPAIGLDAFCQKLLVYEGADGNAVVIFNDIAALAELYYGRSAPPHKMLNERLTETFTNAING